MKTTNEFLEKFLPNYHSRNDVARLDDLTKYLSYDMDAEEQTDKGLYNVHYHQAFFEYEELSNKLFAEALQNFENKICEKQRENCFVAAKIIRKDVILNAEQPKTDEL